MILLIPDLTLSDIYELKACVRERRRAAQYCNSKSEQRVAEKLVPIEDKITDHITAHILEGMQSRARS